MSLKQEILKEIKQMLNEQQGFDYSITAGASGVIPDAHKAFIRRMANAMAPYTRDDPYPGLISTIETALRKGMSTDTIYNSYFNDDEVKGLLANLRSSKPANYTYMGAQRRDTDFVGPPAPSGTSATPRPPRTRRSGGATPATTYFKCKTPEEITATKEYQQKNGLTADGKIGKNTILKLIADKSFDLASKGLTVELILKDPDRQIYHNSICSQLAKTTASASLWGATPIKPGSVQDVTSAKEKWQETGRKCPVGVKEVGPYTVEEIEQVVKILMEQDIKSAYGENLMQTVASRVHYAIHKGDTPDCQDLVDAVFYSLQRGGKVAKKLSGVQTTEKSSEVIDAIQQARAAAAAGDTYVDFALKLDQQVKKGSADAEDNKRLLAIARKYGIFDPKSPNYVAPGSGAEVVAKGAAQTIKSLEESKNWVDKTREGSSNSLFERLIKDISNKKTL